MIKMKKKVWVSLLCVTMAVTTCFSATGCKKKNQQAQGNGTGIVAEAGNAENSKNAVFREESSFELPFDPSNICRNGDQLLFYSMDYISDDYDAAYIDADMDVPVDIPEDEIAAETEGSEQTDADTETPENETAPVDVEVPSDETAPEDGEVPVDGEEIPDAGMDEEYTAYTVAWAIGDASGNVGKTVTFDRSVKMSENVTDYNAEWTNDGDIVVPEKTTTSDGKQVYKTLCFDKDGNLKSETTLNPQMEDEGYRMIVGKDKKAFVSSETTVCVLDENGRQIGKIQPSAGDTLGNFVWINEKLGYITVYDSSYNMGICPVDLESFTVGTKANFTGEFFSTNFKTDAEGNLYTLNTSKGGVFSIAPEGENVNMTLLFGFLDSDILATDVNSYAVMDKDTMLLSIVDPDNYDAHKATLFKKVPPEEVKDKKILVYGSLGWIPSDVTRQILAFNKSNPDYRIRIADYSQYATMDDYTLPEKTLKNDIISNQGPDIISIADMSNPGVYIDKNVFIDLYPYMEKAGLSRSDYFQNVLDAGSKDGKLYMVCPKFMIYEGTIKESVLNGRKALSFTDIQQLEEQYGCKGSGVYMMTRDDMLMYLLTFSGNKFFDPSTGECHFDDGEFAEYLKWIKEYPESFEENYYDMYVKREENIRSNKTIMEMSGMYDFSAFNQAEKGYFGEKIALTSFPGTDPEGGGVIYFSEGFAISSKCQDPEAAFEFVKYFLSEDYLMPEEEEGEPFNYGFPLLIKAFDRCGELAGQKPFHYDANHQKEYYEYTFYSEAQGKDVEITPIAPDRVQYIKDYIQKSTMTVRYDSQVLDIVKEESAYFFNNQKTPEEVANIIQSRVGIYARESL